MDHHRHLFNICICPYSRKEWFEVQVDEGVRIVCLLTTFLSEAGEVSNCGSDTTLRLMGHARGKR